MDQVRLKKIVQSALDISFSGLTIVGFNVLPTHKWDEAVSKWVPDSYSLFLWVKQPLRPEEFPRDIEFFVESLLGFECCVDFV
jgi:hypothetical protein